MKGSVDYNRDNPGADATEDSLSEFVVGAEMNGVRLDKALAALMPSVSRSRLQCWIKDGAVLVNGRPARRVRDAVLSGDVISVSAQPTPEELAFTARDVPFETVYEDEALLVVNKRAGLVVHPGAGHWDDTLLNGLLFARPALAALPRAGIVHRLDRDTSGLMVVAKTLAAQTSLVRQLQSRSVKREYWALLRGQAPERTLIDRPIGRDPRNPLRFAVEVPGSMREARTRLATVARASCGGRAISWAACRLETGRTHQIRVHCESIGLPLLGDPVYRGGLAPWPQDGTPLAAMKRQCLHASRLGLVHPESGQRLEWFAPPPQDLARVMEFLGFGPLDRPVSVFEEALGGKPL
ncbi:RluA family pseudouridine synthase [Mesosutterella sp. AGMB02718]|uniref:Pseudouridine synthase n=1 Tax=Mesosutterella faecium TaxID=2925194 RepID=A0ABT7IJ50_9BURK|nr:RluA family pseudouridine synthase [Mesosutterella sp. AGMB02718]MDL2058405.1 RluA family pseudouridine synthase [Mesosutterella sp. AGMB02718]